MYKNLLFVMIICLMLLTACTAPSTTTPISTTTPTSSSTVDFTTLFPPKLAKDFYPNGLNREALVARLSEAPGKTGDISENETWEGVIHITGDLRILPEASVTITPGTLILVSARSDDQFSGGANPKDRFNPKVPECTEAYSQSRVTIGVDGGLIARGTKEKPIIVTSDATAPQTDDWMGIQFSPGSRGEMERVLVEYCRIIGISSSDVMIKQSILRNIMCTIVIMGEVEELLTLSPTITESYIYNTGQLSVTIRSGAPVITSNIIRPRQDTDLNLPGFEYGAVGVDHPAQPEIRQNFLEGGPPYRYDEYDIWGNYHEFILGTALGCNASISPLTIADNTFYNASNTGLEIYPSMVKVEYNNFISNACNLQLQASLFEPSDAWQKKLFDEGVIQPLRAQVIKAVNNYWGMVSLGEIRKSIQSNGLAEVEYQPMQTDFIEAALPDWQQFLWE